MLYYTILYYTILYDTILNYTIRYYTILCQTKPQMIEWINSKMLIHYALMSSSSLVDNPVIMTEQAASISTRPMRDKEEREEFLRMVMQQDTMTPEGISELSIKVGVAWYGMVWYGMVWYGIFTHLLIFRSTCRTRNFVRSSTY